MTAVPSRFAHSTRGLIPSDDGSGDGDRDGARNKKDQPRDLIVVFQNRHYLLHVHNNTTPTIASVLHFVSDHSNWPVHLLTTCHSQSSQAQLLQSSDNHWFDPYVVVKTKSRILGGKGGFGSLLKSQSRQAGANATTNFGACRDLQGRRLRHVNDAVAAARAKEWHEQKRAGNTADDHQLALDRARGIMETDSRIPGWYLELPAWSDLSKKEYRKWQRQFRLWKQQQEKEKEQKQEKKRQSEARVQDYVSTATQASESVRASLQSALQQGLAKQQEQQQKQKLNPQNPKPHSPIQPDVPAKRSKHQPDPPTALLTLSGDLVLAYEEGKWQVQCQSNFGTFGIVLSYDSVTQRQPSQQSSSSPPRSPQKQDQPHQLYWEVKLITGGLVQIGWAESNAQRFQPNCETGDGVGDDTASYAYDGSRGIVLHESQSQAYGKEGDWKAGDIVGCLYNWTMGTLSFSLNGSSLGNAFTLTPETVLFPAASCNPKEIVELSLSNSEMKHLPDGAIPVGDLLATEHHVQLDDGDNDQEETNEVEEATNVVESNTSKDVVAQDTTNHVVEAKTPSVSSSSPQESSNATNTDATNTVPPTTTHPPEPIDLDQMKSVSDLEVLGLDRLKEALRIRGLKCGGTLQERAQRLWAVKGLAPEDYPSQLLVKRNKQS